MKKIENALSNTVYYDKKNNIILKRYSQDKFKKYFGNQELNILSLIGYNPSIVSTDEISFPYIEHTKWDDKNIAIQDLASIARTLFNLHKIKSNNLKMPGFEKAYKKVLTRGNKLMDGFANHEAYISKQAFKILKSGKQVLLHNDLVAGNLLKTQKSIKLIDFEYGGIGNPIFDLASFITERNLTQQQIDFFIECYGKRNIDKQDLLIVSAFLQIFWTRWALYKYKETKNKTYNEIAHWKLGEYKKIISKIFI